jgi:hypothetical protein
MPDIVVDTSVNGVASDHMAAEAARGDLLGALADFPELSVTQRPLRNSRPTKSLATELVLSVTTSGSLAALVRVARLWLSRDRHRMLKVTVRAGGKETSYDIVGDNVSIDTLRDALEAAVLSESGTNARKNPPKQQ